MGIIAFLILGLLAGAIAKAIMPGDDPGGIIVTMIIGVVGALLGGFLAGELFNTHPLKHFFDLSTFFVPRSMLPPLPEGLQRELGFHWPG